MEEDKHVLEQENKVPAGDPKKMKACKSCGAMIAKSAKRCPSCGAKNKKPIYKRFWFWILAIALVGGIVAAIKDARPIDYSNPDEKVNAAELIREYVKNESAAKDKYGDKTVAVTGIVRSIFDDYIVLDSGVDEFLLNGVRVEFADSNDVKKACEGKIITVVGRCDNMSIANVVIKKAKIDDSMTVKPDYANAQKVDVAALAKDYRDNSVAADDKYLFKVIETTGVVSYVGSDYIVVRSSNTSDFLDDIELGVTVYFEDDATLKNVKNGATVTVVGQCYGSEIIYAAKIERAILK